MDYLASLPLDNEPDEGRRCSSCTGWSCGPKMPFRVKAVFPGNGITTPTLEVYSTYARHWGQHDADCPKVKNCGPFGPPRFYSLAYTSEGRELGEYKSVLWRGIDY